MKKAITAIIGMVIIFSLFSGCGPGYRSSYYYHRPPVVVHNHYHSPTVIHNHYHR